MKYTSIQRWIYADGNTLPNAIRNLATEIENFDRPVDEYGIDDYDLIIQVNYSEDVDDDLYYRAGICLSWKPDNEY